MKIKCSDILESIKKISELTKDKNQYTIVENFLQKNGDVIIDIEPNNFTNQFDKEYMHYIIRIYEKGEFKDYKIVPDSDDSYSLVSIKETNVVWGISDFSPSNILLYLDSDVKDKICDKYELIHDNNIES